MARVIGRIARLADNAQCTSCRACEISGWFQHHRSHGAKEIIERAWMGLALWVCKLEREKERMENANTLGEFVEHPMNLALTAYHRLASVHPIGHQCDADPAIDALYISDSDQR